MEKTFPFEYTVVYSGRKTSAIEISRDGKVTLRVPYGIADSAVNQMLVQKKEWIMSALKKQLSRPEPAFEGVSDEKKELLKKQARAVILPKVKYFAEIMNVTPTRVTITSAKTRFGSCSGKNAISFSCFLMLYPDAAVDYVVVHELAHIKQHNHSARFWQEVEKILPDYKERKNLLKG